jgi:hypothetical protein
MKRPGVCFANITSPAFQPVPSRWFICMHSVDIMNRVKLTKKLNSVALFRNRTIPTERPQLVGEVIANFRGYRVSRGQPNGSPRPLISVFQTRSRYFSIQVAPRLYSRGWVDPVPDPLLLRKSCSVGNRTRDLWICSQEFWPLDHRGGHITNRE